MFFVFPMTASRNSEAITWWIYKSCHYKQCYVTHSPQIMHDGWTSHLPDALQLCTMSILWTEPSAQCLRGAEPKRSGQVPPPPTAQAVTRVYPRAWWDLLRNNMLFSAGLQPGGTGSPCCPHEGRSCLTTEHTWQTARNEVTGLPCWSSG